MSQQGERRDPRTVEQDDWWHQLYAPGAQDAGRTRAGDTLDDRYASVRRTVGASAPPADERPAVEAAEPADEEEAAAREPQYQHPYRSRQSRTPQQQARPQAQTPAQAQTPPQAPPPAVDMEPDPGDARDDGPGPARGDRPYHVGDRPPTYDSEPTALPAVGPAALSELVPDTVLDGAQYGGLTLRAASLRGDSARHRGVLRRDALLTARFGEGASALLLVAVAAGGRSAVDGHRAARELCHAVGETVGRSHARLAEDVGADRRDALRSGLQRLTERCYGKLRAQAAALGARPDEYTAGLRCMVLSADPRVRQRVFFGAGGGGLFRLRGGRWEDVESGERDGERPPQYGDTVPGPGQTGPEQTGPEQTGPGRAEPGQAVPAPAGEEPFRFQAVTARPHEVLLLCSRGLAEPLRAEAEFAERLAAGWARRSRPPGLADFLADVQLRVRGYADDRTAVALWER